MPVYEYQCKSCAREFEYQQRMSDPDKTDCEACNGKLERIISRTAFQLKGGGWYKDLYSSSKPEGGSSASNSESGSSTSSATTSASSSGDSSSAAAPAAPAASTAGSSSSGSSSGGSSGSST